MYLGYNCTTTSISSFRERKRDDCIQDNNLGDIPFSEEDAQFEGEGHHTVGKNFLIEWDLSTIRNCVVRG